MNREELNAEAAGDRNSFWDDIEGEEAGVWVGCNVVWQR